MAPIGIVETVSQWLEYFSYEWKVEPTAVATHKCDCNEAVDIVKTLVDEDKIYHVERHSELYIREGDIK